MEKDKMNEVKIAEMVMREVAEALGRSPDEVNGNNLLKKDLGAESIDLIDLTFRFEKALGRPLSEQEIFRSDRPDGDITVAGVIGGLVSTQASAGKS
jgi:acyl carrier protein